MWKLPLRMGGELHCCLQPTGPVPPGPQGRASCNYQQGLPVEDRHGSWGSTAMLEPRLTY